MLSYDFSNLPQISMTGRVTERVGWSHSGRSLSVNLLVVIHSGSCKFTIDGEEYSYEKGDIAIVPKDTLYSPNTISFCEYTFFHFNGNFAKCEKDPSEISPFDAITHERSTYGYIPQNPQDDSELLFDYKIQLGSHLQNIESLVRKFMSARLNYESKQHIILSLLFSEIMFHISRAYCEKFGSDKNLPPQVNRILTYIKENYTGEINLDDICKNMNMSKQYCMRIFKKHMHSTINDYILDLKMKHAAYLLSSTYMNVSQTADYLGFSGTSYFSRVFKKYYGIAPSDYIE